MEPFPITIWEHNVGSEVTQGYMEARNNADGFAVALHSSGYI
jgi:hypothetical protein